MSYIPHTEAEREQMLSAIGVDSIETMFDAVPAALRFPQLDLPAPQSQLEVMELMTALAEANECAAEYALFRGAGSYHHFIPSSVNHLIQRGEFLTAYTPYQPEMTQGTLQATYEYQSMLCALTGMDAANASHYDGATSLAEAVTTSVAQLRRKRHKIVLSPDIHPHYRDVVRTYHQGGSLQIVGDEGENERLDAQHITALLDKDTAMLAVAYPNFFGEIEDVAAYAEAAHAVGALFVVVANPTALALLKSPGELGADIVVGEGQPLGIPLSFGGPYLGYFATRQRYVRKIAGRIIGETEDADGRLAYVMTLRPREQDIRRDKATSNICTNQGLMSLAACIYLAVLGKHGLRQVASLCYQKAHYAATQISELPGYRVKTTLPFFHEFVLSCPRPVSEINEALIEHGIIGGYDLGQDFSDLADQMLICCTEMNSRAEIDDFVERLAEVGA